jgi:hypothetical protein
MRSFLQALGKSIVIAAFVAQPMKLRTCRDCRGPLLADRIEECWGCRAAALMSERFETAFLRLVREFRNQRRVFSSPVVAGGQVNTTDGQQQMNNNEDSHRDCNRDHGLDVGRGMHCPE